MAGSTLVYTRLCVKMKMKMKMGGGRGREFCRYCFSVHLWEIPIFFSRSRFSGGNFFFFGHVEHIHTHKGILMWRYSI